MVDNCNSSSGVGALVPFLGVNCSYDKARFVIIPVPYGGTLTCRKGAERGPLALLSVSPCIEEFDEVVELDISGEGLIHTLPILDVPPTVEDMVDVVHKRVKEVLDDGKLPVMIGGEHSVSIGAFWAFSGREITIVQIDAHSDLRDEYEGSMFNHACVMARARELFPCVQVGVRSISRGEFERIKRENLCVLSPRDEGWVDKALDCIGTEDVYITIDVDGFDPGVVPGVGTPEPGGLGWYEVVDFLELLIQKHRLVGFDVVELSPIPGNIVSELACARLIYRIMGLEVKYDTNSV